MPGLLFALLAFLGLVVIVLALGYIVTKIKASEPLELSFRNFLLAYFYLMTIASLLVMSLGVASLLQTGMGAALGKEFSYSAPRLREPQPLPASPNGKTGPSIEKQKAEREERLDRQSREGLLQGVSMSVIGGIILGLHWWGRRRLTSGRRDWLPTALRKAKLLILLAIYSVVGLIALPWGIYDALRYYIIPATDRFSGTTPGGVLSVALVFVPLWAYFLVAVIGELKRTETARAT